MLKKKKKKSGSPSLPAPTFSHSVSFLLIHFRRPRPNLLCKGEETALEFLVTSLLCSTTGVGVSSYSPVFDWSLKHP